MELLQFVVGLVGLGVIAAPLCLVSIGVYRIVSAAHHSAMNQAKRATFHKPATLSNQEAAKLRAFARAQARELE